MTTSSSPDTAPETARIARTARVALVGDRSPSVRAHTRVPGLLAALAEHERLDLDAYWIPTPDAEPSDALDGFDAVWLLPGSPYRSEAGALAAVRGAREHGTPFLGTCGGFQHALLEYARDVCGLTGTGHAENEPESTDPLIVPLSCSLVGHEGVVTVTPGSLAERALGSDRTVARYHCSYGPDPERLPALTAHGLRVSGVDGTGAARVVELPGHPFFLATLFQPELADGSRAHPVIRAWAAAAVAHAARAARA